MVAPLNTCATIEQRGVVRFLWEKVMVAKEIHKEMLPTCGKHCLSHQTVHNWVQKSSEGRTSIEDERRVGRPVEMPRRQRILRRRFPRTCKTAGKVFKCVWRLCWKINVVCMSLSSFVSFQSRFVTYLLKFPRKIKSRHRTQLAALSDNLLSEPICGISHKFRRRALSHTTLWLQGAATGCSNWITIPDSHNTHPLFQHLLIYPTVNTLLHSRMCEITFNVY
jgi:hypothetical protein